MSDLSDDDIKQWRAEDKPNVILYLADCGLRLGISNEEKVRLDQLRIAVAKGYEAQDKDVTEEAKKNLLEFYQQLSEISNYDRSYTPEEAAESDAVRLENAVKRYSPDEHYLRGR